MARTFIKVMGFGLFFVSVGFLASFFYWAAKMIEGRKKDVAVFDARVWHNPFNLFFRPKLLTEDGNKARIWILVSLAGFLFSLAVSAMFDGLASLAK